MQINSRPEYLEVFMILFEVPLGFHWPILRFLSFNSYHNIELLLDYCY